MPSPHKKDSRHPREGTTHRHLPNCTDQDAGAQGIPHGDGVATETASTRGNIQAPTQILTDQGEGMGVPNVTPRHKGLGEGINEGGAVTVSRRCQGLDRQINRQPMHA